MPIKGLTDKGARFPRLGTIHKGEPKTDGKVGQDTDYFRLDSKLADVQAKWTKVLGDKPKSIPCLIPHENVDSAFEAWREEWGKSGLMVRCDGENQVIWFDKATNKLITNSPKPCRNTCDESRNAGCNYTGRLNILIPALGEGGYFEVQTHSKWDISGLSEQLEAVQAIYGSLFGIPLLLERSEREISVPTPQGRMKATKSLLSIRIHPKKAQQLLAAAEQRAFAAIVEPTALPSADDWHADGAKWAMEQGISPDTIQVLLSTGLSKAEFFSRIKAIAPKLIEGA